MDKIAKALKKLLPAERQEMRVILNSLKTLNFTGFDIKKLKGRNDVYRIRKGSLRIIFLKKKEKISILTIERRNDNTYR